MTEYDGRILIKYVVWWPNSHVACIISSYISNHPGQWKWIHRSRQQWPWSYHCQIISYQVHYSDGYIDTYGSLSSSSAGPVVWSTVFVTSNPHVRPCCVSNSLVPVNSTIILTINADHNNSNRYTVNLFYCNVERRSIDPMVKIDLSLKVCNDGNV